MTDIPAKIYAGRIDLTDRNAAWTKIVELVGHSKRVLEIGCASGYMSEFLARQRDCRVTGIELNPRAAADAAAHCEVVVADVEGDALDRIAGRFDVIICADVLEHLRDPLRVLRVLRDRLSKNGYLLVSLPNVAHWEVRRALLFGRFDYTRTGILDDTHLRFFTYDTALRLLHDAGLDIDRFDLVFRGPRYWKYDRFYRRWERPIHWLVSRFCRGLFGYQFIFRLRQTPPQPRAFSTPPVELVSGATDSTVQITRPTPVSNVSHKD